MSFVNWVKSINKIAAITGISLIIGAVGLYIGFREPTTEITFTSVNQTNVLDIHKELEDLTVLFQGRAIGEGDLNIRIVTLSVENTGQKNILQDYYAREGIWGIKVENGEIIEARLVDSSSNYISENIGLNLIEDENIVEFGKIIFDRGEYFLVELLVLHEKTELPTILPVGKLAGIGEMEIVESRISEEDRRFVSRLVEGNALVHLVRSISYLFIFMFGILAIALPIVGITGLFVIRKRRIRRKRVKMIVGRGDVKEGDIHSVLMDIYAKEGLESLKKIKELLGNKSRLADEAIRYVRFREQLNKIPARSSSDRIVFLEGEKRYISTGHAMPRELEVVGGLISKDVVKVKAGNVIEVDGDFKKSLKSVLPHLEAWEALEYIDKR